VEGFGILIKQGTNFLFHKNSPKGNPCDKLERKRGRLRILQSGKITGKLRVNSKEHEVSRKNICYIPKSGGEKNSEKLRQANPET